MGAAEAGQALRMSAIGRIRIHTRIGTPQIVRFIYVHRDDAVAPLIFSLTNSGFLFFLGGDSYCEVHNGKGLHSPLHGALTDVQK
jgi:hypothetical protein